MTATQTTPFHEPRRRDRAIRDEEWIEALLHRAPMGVLALVHEEVPKAVPNLFVFEASRRSIYLHAARTGETRDILETSPPVSFCVSEMGRLLPAEAARDFSVEYASVVLEGRSHVVEDPQEAHRALELLMSKFAPHLQPGRDYSPVEPRDLKTTSVFRIDIERWSAKGKSSTQEDAYAYRAATTERGCPVHDTE